MATASALDVLKMLLGITDSGQNGLLSFLIDDATALILGYCRIDALPDGLHSLVPVIAADMYRAKGYGSTDVPKVVAAETQGNRSWTYENASTDTDGILLSYEARLKPFVNRRGRVPSDIC